MGRHLGPVVRLSRREGVDLGHKSRRSGEKVAKRLSQVPGQHGPTRRGRKSSDYGIQLREKQKLKRIYGMLERQFRVFFDRASRKGGVTGENLIQLLERRLDNVIYRLYFAATRREARQMVSHGLISVNGRCVNIPSFMVKPGDKVEPRKRESTLKRIREKIEQYKDLALPEWLSVDGEKLEAQVLRMPTKADAKLPVEESLIIELYSK